MEKLGVKETLELLEGLKEVGVVAGKALKDGKLTVGDLPLVLELLQKLGVLKEAVEGVGEIPKELKDLTQEEVTLVLQKVWEVVSAIVAAKKGE